MFDEATKAEMKSRFGDRFAGMQLTHVDLLFWPVWRHRFFYTVFEAVELDPLEEGLLLMVAAGVETLSDAASLLGCSERYALQMATRMLGNSNTYSYLSLDDQHRLLPTVHTSAASQRRERLIPVEKELALLRDATFGNWLSYGDVAFDETAIPTSEDGRYRWLAPSMAGMSKDEDAASYALTLAEEKEVAEYELQAAGTLGWVSLWLGCYQPLTGSGGRYLLFNPGNEDAPLLDLSIAFEQELGRSPIKMYFPDDSLRTSAAFWQAIASRTSAERKREELETQRSYLSELSIRAEKVSRPARPVVEPLNTVDVPVVFDKRTEEISELRQIMIAMESKVAVLQRALESMPRIEHIEADQHPAVLLDAINNASEVLIMICPWIRRRVLKPLLPAIDKALRRGCCIWIGYGMPKNIHHPDNSDEDAIAELRKRQTGGQLHLAHLSTHEKVLIQDDRVFVNSSFNFLSYTGGDGRRESGTIQRGGVATIRNKFLDAFGNQPAVSPIKSMTKVDQTEETVTLK